MTAAMQHWATPLIGKPWAPYGDGPHAYSCWGLVRAVFRAQHGIDLPEVRTTDLSLGSIENFQAIRTAARISGWRPAEQPPQPDDVVLMRSVIRLHAGLALRVDGVLGVLHSAHGAGVLFQPWREATQGMNIELWRRAP